MTLALTSPGDALEESRRLLATLERHQGQIPLVEQLLATHRPAHAALEANHTLSDQAVMAWRVALAARWECEIAGRRIYNQIYRQLIAYYGSATAPEVRLLSRNGAEADSTPSQLLDDLGRMRAALLIGELPFATQRLAELDEVAAALEGAITHANQCEAQRRSAVLNRRMAQEAFRRMFSSTSATLRNQCGLDVADQ